MAFVLHGSLTAVREERRSAVEKIMIVGSHSSRNKALATLLKAIFSECDVKIVSKNPESRECSEKFGADKNDSASRGATILSTI